MTARTPAVVVAGWLMACLVACEADAQEQQVLRLTLDEAQARAQQASHRLAELQARETAAHATADVSRAAGQPVLTFVGGYTRTNHVPEFAIPTTIGRPPSLIYPDIPSNWRTRFDLQWPIYTGGRIDALESAARAEASAAGSELAAGRADLRLEVARAFWALVTARSSVDVLARALERAEAHASDVRERLRNGLVAPNEVASAEAQASRERMLLISARNQRDVSSADLARLVGESLLISIEPMATLEAPPTLPGAFEALLTEARAGRDDRRAIERRIDAAEDRQVAARAGALPYVTAGGGYDYARPNPRIFPRADVWNDSWDASINVSWSLWDGGRTRAEMAQAAANAESIRQRLADFDTTLALEVRQRLLEIDSSRAEIAAANDAVRSAEEARRVVEDRFAVGVVTHTEVLDAQLALLQAELDRTRALANVRLSEARLERALGR